jgi:hypothetical protein
MYILPEIWAIIFRMTNHMIYFKPQQFFGKEIECPINLSSFDYDQSKSLIWNLNNRNLRINQLCWLRGFSRASKNKGYYMITDLNEDYKIISLVKIDLKRSIHKGYNYAIIIYKSSPIRILTFEEFDEEDKMLYDNISDYNASLSHCIVIC